MKRPCEWKTRSQNGTPTMAGEKISLTAPEIIAIMEAAERFGVSQLHYGPLSLWMGQTDPPEASPLVEDPYKQTIPAAEIAAIQKQESEKSMIQRELAEKDREISQMFIENPAQAEAMLSSGELDDGDDGIEDEEA